MVGKSLEGYHGHCQQSGEKKHTISRVSQNGQHRQSEWFHAAEAQALWEGWVGRASILG